MYCKLPIWNFSSEWYLVTRFSFSGKLSIYILQNGQKCDKQWKETFKTTSVVVKTESLNHGSIKQQVAQHITDQ